MNLLFLWENINYEVHILVEALLVSKTYIWL